MIPGLMAKRDRAGRSKRATVRRTATNTKQRVVPLHRYDPPWMDHVTRATGILFWIGADVLIWTVIYRLLTINSGT